MKKIRIISFLIQYTWWLTLNPFALNIILRNSEKNKCTIIFVTVYWLKEFSSFHLITKKYKVYSCSNDSIHTSLKRTAHREKKLSTSSTGNIFPIKGNKEFLFRRQKKFNSSLTLKGKIFSTIKKSRIIEKSQWEALCSIFFIRTVGDFKRVKVVDKNLSSKGLRDLWNMHNNSVLLCTFHVQIAHVNVYVKVLRFTFVISCKEIWSDGVINANLPWTFRNVFIWNFF